MSEFWKKLGNRFVEAETLDSGVDIAQTKTKQKESVKSPDQKAKASAAPGKTKTNIAPIQWWHWFWASAILGGIGGFLMSYAATKIAFNLKINGFYNVALEGIYWFGIAVLTISAIVGIVAMKEMFAESFVRAMEVYHGKKRAIECDDTVSNNWSWGE